MSPCQALGYPCRLADVSQDALEREHTIDMLVFEAIERGDRSNQIVEALEGTEGLEWIRATSNSEVSYKVQGSIPKLAILEGFRRDDLGSVGGLMPSLDTQDPTQTTRRARLVVDEPLHARTLKLASMAEWESGLTLGSLGGKANPNLGLVGQAIEDAPSYDLERVDALHIGGAITSRTPGAAWLDGFRDWRNYPYVIVHAHGTIQDLNEELNKGHLFTLTTDFPPTLEGARECAKYIQSTVYGLDVIPGLVCIPFKKSYDIGVTMDTLSGER